MTARRSVPVLLLTALVTGLLSGMVGLAGVVTPAARAAGDGFTVSATHESVEVGTRPTFEIAGDETTSGRLRVVVLSTFGGGKGLPKDKREWQTRVRYEGRPVSVEGPVLRVGDYRVKVWFVPGDGGAEGAPSGAPQASATFTVRTVDSDGTGRTDGDDQGKAAPDDTDNGGSGAVLWIVLALVLLAGAVVVAVRLLRTQAPGRRRRTDDASTPAPAPSSAPPPSD